MSGKSGQTYCVICKNVAESWWIIHIVVCVVHVGIDVNKLAKQKKDKVASPIDDFEGLQCL